MPEAPWHPHCATGLVPISLPKWGGQLAVGHSGDYSTIRLLRLDSPHLSVIHLLELPILLVIWAVHYIQPFLNQAAAEPPQCFECTAPYIEACLLLLILKVPGWSPVFFRI